MNKSEIAERREEKFRVWYKANYLKIAGVSSWAERAWAAYEAGADEERAIAESQAPQPTVSYGPPHNRDGEAGSCTRCGSIHRGVVKNRDCPGGKEFWDHVEKVAAEQEANSTIIEASRENKSSRDQIQTVSVLAAYCKHGNSYCTLCFAESKRTRVLIDTETKPLHARIKQLEKDLADTEATCEAWMEEAEHLKAPTELGDGEPSPPPSAPKCKNCGSEIRKQIWGKFAGAWIHIITQHPKCPTAGNMSGETNWMAEPVESVAAHEVSPPDSAPCSGCNGTGYYAGFLMEKKLCEKCNGSVGFVSEIRPRPDDPSCHVCGAQMVVKEWKCLSCKSTTGVQEVSPPSWETKQIWDLITRIAESRRDDDTCILSKRACQKLLGQRWIRENVESDKLATAIQNGTNETKCLGDTRELKAALKLAKTRLEICLGRFAGCEDGKYSKTTVTYGDKVEKRHEVSLAEIPAWIEEMNELLG